MTEGTTIYVGKIETGLGGAFEVQAWTLLASDRGLCRLLYPGEDAEAALPWLERHWPRPVLREDAQRFERTGIAGRLRDYFAGKPVSFREAPLDLRGTDFQRRVWEALGRIPYGEARSYRQLAEQVGCPKAVRAVGAANGRNPLPIIVPCHRVIGNDGSLTGYRGGIELKRELLAMEGIVCSK